MCEKCAEELTSKICLISDSVEVFCWLSFLGKMFRTTFSKITCTCRLLSRGYQIKEQTNTFAKTHSFFVVGMCWKNSKWPTKFTFKLRSQHVLNSTKMTNGICRKQFPLLVSVSFFRIKVFYYNLRHCYACIDTNLDQPFTVMPIHCQNVHPPCLYFHPLF